MRSYILVLEKLDIENVYQNLYVFCNNSFTGIMELEQLPIRKYRLMIKVHNIVQARIKAATEKK